MSKSNHGGNGVGHNVAHNAAHQAGHKAIHAQSPGEGVLWGAAAGGITGFTIGGPGARRLVLPSGEFWAPSTGS